MRALIPILTLTITLALQLALPADSRAEGFGRVYQWHDWFGIADEVPLVGDFDGDDLDDLVTFAADGSAYVALSDGDRFVGTATRWHGGIAPDGAVYGVGDFDGDGLDDVVAFVRSSQTGAAQGDVYVARSDGNRFGTATRWHDWFSIDNEVPLVGDFDGDHRDDIVTFSYDGNVYVALSRDDHFVGTGTAWKQDFLGPLETPGVGDFDGDEKDDIVRFVGEAQSGSGRGDVHVALSQSDAFAASSRWNDWFAIDDEVPGVGDFDGDGRDDIVTFVPGEAPGGDVYVALSRDGLFASRAAWHAGFHQEGFLPRTGRFNRDAKDDIAVFLRSSRSGSIQGDVWVSLTDEPSTPRAVSLAPFGYADMRPAHRYGGQAQRAEGERPLLVFLMQTPGTTLAQTNSSVDQLVFGPSPGVTVNDWFLENSNDRFSFERTVVLGPVDYWPKSSYPLQISADIQCTRLNDFSDECFTKRDDAFRGETLHGKGAQAIIRAELAGVDFSDFDVDGDLRVTADELSILVVDNETQVGAANRLAGCRLDWSQPGPEPPCRQQICVMESGAEVPCPEQICVMASGVEVCVEVSGVGERTTFANITHELSHQLGARGDLYGASNLNSQMSMMGGVDSKPVDDRRTYHLDPWHKMRLGWLEPEVYSLRDPGSCKALAPPQDAESVPGEDRVALLYDPEHGNQEYFMLEQRDPASGGYDKNVKSAGIGLWHVLTDSDHRTFRLPSLTETGKTDWSVNHDGFDDSGGTVTAKRGDPTAWLPDHGTIFMPYEDGSWSHLFLRAGQLSADGTTRDVEWGFDELLGAHIESADASARAGQRVTLQGTFGTLSRDITLVSDDFEAQVSPDGWSCGEVSFTVPNDAPAGDYRAQIHDYAGSTQAGTWIELAVEGRPRARSCGLGFEGGLAIGLCALLRRRRLRRS